MSVRGSRHAYRLWIVVGSLLAVAILTPLGTVGATSSFPLAPVVTAAPINETAITVTWSAPPGVIMNYTIEYARFYGVPIAWINVAGTKHVYNVTELGMGLTYYFTVWAWNSSGMGAPSNVAAAQTNAPTPPPPPFPTSTVAIITTLSVLFGLVASILISVYVSGKRGATARGASAIALGRSSPRRTSYSAMPVRRPPGRR